MYIYIYPDPDPDPDYTFLAVAFDLCNVLLVTVIVRCAVKPLTTEGRSRVFSNVLV